MTPKTIAQYIGVALLAVGVFAAGEYYAKHQGKLDAVIEAQRADRADIDKLKERIERHLGNAPGAKAPQ